MGVASTCTRRRPYITTIHCSTAPSTAVEVSTVQEEEKKPNNLDVNVTDSRSDQEALQSQTDAEKKKKNCKIVRQKKHEKNKIK